MFVGLGKAIERSCWVLMARDVLPESASKSYVDQQAMVADLSIRASATYKVPKTLEATVCIFAQYFSSYVRSQTRYLLPRLAFRRSAW